MLILVNILPYFGWGFATILLLRPLIGAWAVVVAVPILAYPLYAWLYADRVVAKSAGFRPPTWLQERYFEFLELDHRILTHPSLAVAAGVVAGGRGKTFLLTAGLTRYLTDTEIINLVRALDSRDNRSVFHWTFHMATAGAMQFLAAPKQDFGSQWLRAVVVSAAIISALTASLIVVYVNVLSGALPLWLSIATLLIPLFVLVAWVGWSAGVLLMSRWSALRWNNTVWVSDMKLRPMSKAERGFGNEGLRLLSAGLVSATDIPEHREEQEYEDSPVADDLRQGAYETWSGHESGDSAEVDLPGSHGGQFIEQDKPSWQSYVG